MQKIVVFIISGLVVWIIIELLIGYLSLQKYTTDIDFIPSNNESPKELKDKFIKKIVSIHAVYNIEKLKKYINKYEAIETDIIYTDNGLFLSHNEPIDKGSITLDKLFEYLGQYYIKHDIQKQYQKYIWLDIKNITEDNYEIIINIIINEADKNQINRNKIIIESPKINFLPQFSNYGLLTSYYFSPSFSNNKDDEKIIASLKDNIENYYVDFISCNHKYFRFVNRLFPKKMKNYWYEGGSIQMKIRSVFIKYFIFKEETSGILILDF